MRSWNQNWLCPVLREEVNGLMKGKNCVMLKVNILVMRFLTYLVYIKWIRAIPTLIVHLYFSLPNWLKWMKLLEIAKNYSLSPITFSKSLLIVLNKTIG